MSDVIRDFKDLIVWRKARQLVKAVYILTRSFPKDEQYCLTAQIRRAVISVPSNIAEGHARQGHEYAHFLSIARGSMAEVECQLLLAVDLDYLREEQLKDVNDLMVEIRRMSVAIARKL
jgi:four helix bundle protein